MGERMRAFDWKSHPLGPPEGWPQALRMAVSLCLNSAFPTAIYWGEEMYLLYNDAWSPIPAEKHPHVLGQPARRAWSDIWHVIGEQFESVVRDGRSFALYEQMLPMERGGRARETWWNYSLTPIRHADNSVGGIFNQGHEVTDVVFARRERAAELERWRDRLRQAPAGVALLRGPEHRFEFANPAYLELVGERDLIGQPVQEALPEVVTQGFIDLLDGVYRTGETYVGRDVVVKLRRGDEALEERTVDFFYQPTRDAAGEVDGIFVLVLDMTARAKAEAALRISNWQLGEERARLNATVEAEQRARTALRRFSETLEVQVRSRTAELTSALQRQSAIADRMRATFDTVLLYTAFLEVDGTVRDVNRAALAGIHGRLEQVVGQPFWNTPWFAATPGMPERIRQAVETAKHRRTVRERIELELPGGRRIFDFLVRPALDAAGLLIGLVPEAVEVPAPD